jgi:replicative DNA helicase
VDESPEKKRGDVVLFDYMQNAPSEGRENRYIEIGKASRALVTTALANQCVIIAGAQLGREVEKNGGRPATQADLRESGNLETDAHNIIAIEPQDYKGNNDPAYVHVLKAREATPTYERMSIEAVKQYVHWVGTEKYKGAKTEKEKKALTQEEKENAARKFLGLN